MTSPFTFVPRTLAKGKRKVTPHAPRETAPSLSSSTLSSIPAVGSPNLKANYSNEDYSNLVSLAVSDYALWSDPDLRRTMDVTREPGLNEDGGEGEGFFPLSHLLKRSKVLGSLSLTNLQTPIAKALRADPASLLEVRLLVSEPSSSSWSAKHDAGRDIGAYEVRRKENLPRASHNYSKREWEERTVYMVCLTGKHSSIMQDYHNALERTSSNSAPSRVQGINFLPHHQDKPGDTPACKGFALVVLEETLDVDFLLSRWPWTRRPDDDSVKEAGEKEACESSAQITEAAKFGFRTLSKTQWDRLKEEYLSYRERLVAEINTQQDVDLELTAPLPTSKPIVETKEAVLEILDPPPVELLTLSPSSPYPYNSLVFVRNVHPETNKTTLRKLFAAAFASSIVTKEMKSDPIDYVDFNKGMDTCHLRLATPQHARVLVDYFIANPTIHTHGLDEVGSPNDGTLPQVLMEVVTGKREQLYWEKVPMKVRQQAVQKALASVEELIFSCRRGWWYK
ncbi:hypothetical protein H0H92_005283 [Tricholoma furcatifolium]|nr:hypothetical protein H0H92_005283 [Tricholoma furcatifolium]